MMGPHTDYRPNPLRWPQPTYLLSGWYPEAVRMESGDCPRCPSTLAAYWTARGTDFLICADCGEMWTEGRPLHLRRGGQR